MFGKKACMILTMKIYFTSKTKETVLFLYIRKLIAKKLNFKLTATIFDQIDEDPTQHYILLHWLRTNTRIRDTQHLLKVINQLNEKGVFLAGSQEPQIVVDFHS